MKHLISIFVLFFSISTLLAQTSAVVSTERHVFTSTILEEDRAYQVYLPPSYFYSEQGSFPVIYLMDGDYNFHYDTGLIEFLSSVADKMPEAIVIGISDKGSTKYRDYCRPNTNNKNGGNANKFMAFIQDELKPIINKKYRASDYDIIIGHSMGGLFVSNYFLEQPNDFDTYIAIDPSLWWNDYAMASKADSILQTRKQLSSNLFISQANTQGMGIKAFVGVLDKYFPYESTWNYHHYKDESHGSVHMIAIQDALLTLFKGWEISPAQFYAFESAQGLIDHYKKFNTTFASQLTLPAYSFGSMMNYYHRKDLTNDIALLEKEISEHFPNSLDGFYIALAGYQVNAGKLDEAKKTYNTCIAKRPNSFRAYQGLAKVYSENKDYKNALSFGKKALELALKSGARQYQLNELQTIIDNTEQ